MMSQEMATKYVLVLGKCLQEPCVKISVVLCCATCMKVSAYNINKFWEYNWCKNVVIMSDCPMLEALYKYQLHHYTLSVLLALALA